MSYYREQLETWLKTIRVKTDRVVDIGGASNPARTRVGSYEVQETIFLDNGAEEPVVDFIDFDINKPVRKQLIGYGNLDQSVAFKFDVVFCLEVFEYVWNPVVAVQNIFDLMNNDSVAYISFPSIYPVHNPIGIDYLRYTVFAIYKYLIDVGFQNEHIDIVPRVATKGRDFLRAFYSEEGMHPVKNSDDPYNIGYLVKARRLLLV